MLGKKAKIPNWTIYLTATWLTCVALMVVGIAVAVVLNSDRRGGTFWVWNSGNYERMNIAELFGHSVLLSIFPAIVLAVVMAIPAIAIQATKKITS